MHFSCLADHKEAAERIAQWYFDEWGRKVLGVTKASILEKMQIMTKNRRDFPMILTIYDESKLVGAVELKFREHKDFPQYEHWLGGVYMRQDMRGRGYAKALLTKAIKHAESLGIKTLYLQCEPHNENFYRKLGFKPVHAAKHAGIQTTIFDYNIDLTT